MNLQSIPILSAQSGRGATLGLEVGRQNFVLGRVASVV